MAALDKFIKSSDQLVEFSEYFGSIISSDYSMIVLEIHESELNQIWTKVKNSYEVCSDDPSIKDDVASIKAKYQESLKTFVRCMSQIREGLADLQKTKMQLQRPPKPTDRGANFTLPPCDTDVFAGDYLTWPTFRDMFTAIYIDNTRLSKVEVLYHLIQKTKGEARELVKKVPLTNNGFDIAWENLVNRYENKRILINNQLKSLFNLPQCTIESGGSIKRLQREINNCISTLQLYNITISSWDPIFVYLCSSRLPGNTLTLWEQSITTKTEIPKWIDLDNFLTGRFQTLEAVSDFHPSTSSSGNKSNPSKTKDVKSYHSHVDSAPFCRVCKGNHPLRHCSNFMKMNVDNRIAAVKQHHYCLNCLSANHMLRECKSNFFCFKCKKNHHTLLHKENQKVFSAPKTNNAISNSSCEQPSTSQSDTKNKYVHATQIQPSSNSEIQSTLSSASDVLQNVQSCFTAVTKKVLLGTALVNINHHGVTYKARALIDPASEGSFITDRLRCVLKLPFKPISAQVSGINGSVSNSPTKITNFHIESTFNSNAKIEVTALVISQITGNLPSHTFDPSKFPPMPSLQYADPQCFKSSYIDLLIGGDLYPLIILEGIQKNIFGSLVAQDTIFGWILTGPMPPPSNNFSNSTCTSLCTEVSINEQLAQFWSIEEVPQKRIASKEDQYCEDYYSNTTYRNNDGRYVVSLPFKPSYPNEISLGSSRSIAISQFLRNEKSLLRKPELKAKYDSVIKEYDELCHMSECKPSDLPNYYLPHHAVIKPDRTTTKLRVVFNASCSSSNGNCLNDVLYPGPVLQSDLTILILKWRFFKYVFNADIEKMYRQILVHPEHTRFQRIVFRNSPNDPIKEFELKTVTFGVNCAPFLAIRTLLQLAEDEQERYPLASKILKESIYVDDILSGAHDVSHATKARDQLISALESAGFHLRKWTSNNKEFLNELPREHLLNADFLSLEDRSTAKTLGIRWNASTDLFYFAIEPLQCKPTYTKREVLGIIAKLFDPAGWLSPVIITAKIIMQQIWLDKTEWDDNLKPLTLHSWQAFVTSYSQINSVTLPRWLGYTPLSKIEFHAFCDASQKAYAASIYIRIKLEDGNVHSHLLMSKSKVAPIKTISLPRLELCGAVLLSNLVESVCSQLHFDSYPVYCWTDSTIVLSWLKKPPCAWTTFVANRISLILEKVGNSNWAHVETNSNPADLATRGLTPSDLVNNKLWWQGPSWLKLEKNHWPQTKDTSNLTTTLELKPLKTHFASSAITEDLLNRFSSFPRLVRVVAYIFRFFHKVHKSPTLTSSYDSIRITAAEFTSVKTRLIIISQRLYFPKEYQNLLQKRQIDVKSPLLSLTPFLDSEQVVRANGRLVSSPTLTYRERHPIILSYNSRFARLYVEFVHAITLHGGNQLMARVLRLEFWIVRLKNLIKTCIFNCKTCVIEKKKYSSQIMASLPPERTIIGRPFSITGVDFTGSFDIKSFTGRACKITKGYVCLFVCFSTKAIHLEPTSDLSTSSFMAALSRFIARRGCPNKIFSDNGTNFLGASKQLVKDSKDFITQLKDEAIEKYGYQQLSWHFIPVAAPHMGGLWEAGVKSFKRHFRKITGQMKYTFEEFSTLLTRIESCLNSRPLSPNSTSISDFTALTPGHFLIGSPLLSPAEPENLSSIDMLDRWRRLKAIYQQFCNRWKHEYLIELHKRYKWKYPQTNIQIGDLVVLRNETVCPTEWRLGRVVKTYVGNDSLVRVAEVLTQRGLITRPIHKLVVLPSQ